MAAQISLVSDYVVVGAGSAGSVIVRRLIEAGHSVHVIEAGPADTSPAIPSLQGWMALLGGTYDWGLFTTPHCLVPQLPFGGVGASGMGAYHGRWGFEALSHRRAVLAKPARPDPMLVYPPYTDRAVKITRKLF